MGKGPGGWCLQGRVRGRPAQGRGMMGEHAFPSRVPPGETADQRPHTEGYAIGDGTGDSFLGDLDSNNGKVLSQRSEAIMVGLQASSACVWAETCARERCSAWAEEARGLPASETQVRSPLLSTPFRTALRRDSAALWGLHPLTSTSPTAWEGASALDERPRHPGVEWQVVELVPEPQQCPLGPAFFILTKPRPIITAITYGHQAPV